MNEEVMKVFASIAEAFEKAKKQEFCFILNIGELSSIEAACMTTALQFKDGNEEDKKNEAKLLAIIKKLDAQYKAQTGHE